MLSYPSHRSFKSNLMKQHESILLQAQSAESAQRLKDDTGLGDDHQG